MARLGDNADIEHDILYQEYGNMSESFKAKCTCTPTPSIFD